MEAVVHCIKRREGVEAVVYCVITEGKGVEAVVQCIIRKERDGGCCPLYSIIRKERCGGCFPLYKKKAKGWRLLSTV